MKDIYAEGNRGVCKVKGRLRAKAQNLLPYTVLNNHSVCKGIIWYIELENDRLMSVLLQDNPCSKVNNGSKQFFSVLGTSPFARLWDASQ